MPRCLPGSLRSVQLLFHHLVEMRDRAVCHQHSNGRRYHVLVWWDPVMQCLWRRGGVQELIPEEPQWPIDVLWIPPLPRPPWRTCQWDRIQTSEVESQWCSVCGEEEGSKNWSLRNPSDQLMCSGFLPPRPPWRTCQWDRIQTSEVESQWCPVMRGWTGGSDD